MTLLLLRLGIRIVRRGIIVLRGSMARRGPTGRPGGAAVGRVAVLAPSACADAGEEEEEDEGADDDDAEDDPARPAVPGRVGVALAVADVVAAAGRDCVSWC